MVMFHMTRTLAGFCILLDALERQDALFSPMEVLFAALKFLNERAN